MEKHNVKLFGFFTIVILLIILTIAIFWPFLKPIITSALLAILTMPVYKILNKYIKSKTLSALIATVGIIFVLFLPLIFIGVKLYNEMEDLIQYLQQVISKNNFELSANLIINKFPHELSSLLIAFKNLILKFEIDIFNTAQQIVQSLAKYLAENSIIFAKNILWFTIEIFIVLVTTYFMLRDSEEITSFIKDLSPFRKDETLKLFEKTKIAVKASVLGSILVSIIQGIMGGFAFYVLGLPSPLFWGVVMTIVGIMPVIGPSTIWLPAAIILLLQGEIFKGIALILWGSAVMGFADNLLRPYFVGKGADYHPLLVFFSIFGAVILMGPIGFFLGPIILSLTLTSIEFIKERYKD